MALRNLLRKCCCWRDLVRNCTATAIPFIYSFSGNSAASAPISTFMCLWAIYISQTHECGNWDWGPDIPFLGIFVSNFRHFVYAVCPLLAGSVEKLPVVGGICWETAVVGGICWETACYWRDLLRNCLLLAGSVDKLLLLAGSVENAAVVGGICWETAIVSGICYWWDLCRNWCSWW